MRRIQKTLSDASGGAKQTAALSMDIMNRPETSLQVVVTGTVNWTIQQTLDDPLDATATLNWFDHPDLNLVAQTVSRQGNYAYIPAAVRLVLTSGTGSVTLTIIQAGING
jgi:hypothetical protein